MRFKLVAAMVFSGLLALGTAGWLGFSTSRQTALKDRGQFLAQQARRIAEKVDQELESHYTETKVQSINSVNVAEPWFTSMYFKVYLDLYEDYDAMLLADTEGKVLASNGFRVTRKYGDSHPLQTVSVQRRSWFRQVLKSGGKTGAAFFAGLQPNPYAKALNLKSSHTLIYSAPVFGRQGDLSRVLVHFASFDRTIGRILRQEADYLKAEGNVGTVVTIHDLSGRELATTRSEDHPRHHKSFEQMTDGDLHRGQVFSHAEDGVPMLGGVAETPANPLLGRYRWRVIVEQPMAAAEAHLAGMTRTFIIAGVLTSLFLILLSLYLGNRLVKPLEMVVSSLDQLATGDFTVKL